ncbi:MAG: arylsulfatase [Halioglobus sp.]
MIGRPLCSGVMSIGLAALLAVFIQGASAQGDQSTEVSAKRPNIVLLVGDDMGLGDIGPFGSEIHTPSLNMMAKQGVRFSNFHASPVCSITRSQLLTGNNNIEIGLASFDYAVYPEAKGKPGYEGYLTEKAVTIQELLRDAGYDTYQTGKWHLGGQHGGRGPHDMGFTHSYGILAGGSNHWNSGDMLPNMAHPDSQKAAKAGQIPPMIDMPYFEDGKPVERPLGIYSDDLYTGKMLSYMEQSRRSGTPFFAYLAFTTAHLPIQAPGGLAERYYEQYRELGWDGLKAQRMQQLVDAGILPQDSKLPANNPITRPWDSLSEDEKDLQAKIFATYAGMIESQDRHIGRVMDWLRETGELDNTLIIYMTDNGPEGTDAFGELGNPALSGWMEKHFSQDIADVGHGNSNWQIGIEWANATTGSLQWWKWFIDEGGIRVPLIVVPPKSYGDKFTRQGDVSDTFLSVKDLPMTILQYAGVEHPMTSYQGRDIVPPSGKSMVNFLDGEAKTVYGPEDWTAFELFGNAYVVRGEYKAIKVRAGMWGDGKWHLYHLRNDPAESMPLEAQMPEELAELVALYEAYAEKWQIQDVREDWNPQKELGH